MHKLKTAQLQIIVVGMLLLCLGAPLFLTYNVTVIPAFYNEASASVAWGLVIMVVLYFSPITRKAFKKIAPLIAPAAAIFVVQIVAIALHFATGKGIQYGGLVCMALFVLLGGLMCLIIGAHLQANQNLITPGEQFLRWAPHAVVAIGSLQMLFGWVQYFGLQEYFAFISRLETGRRIYGNLRQPNLYALLMVVNVVCLLWFADASQQRSLRARFGLIVLAALSIAAVTLSASRMGFVLLCCIGLWGLFELKSSRLRGFTYICVPLLYFSFHFLFTLLDRYGVLNYFGGVHALSLTQAANLDRFSIWSAALKLISDYPMLGVGFKRFAQFAFTDGHAVLLHLHLENAHNGIMQLALDFGVPIMLAVLGLLGFCAYKCLPLAQNLTGRTLLFLLSAPLLHQMVEYPMEYTYFLFPWAFLLGVMLIKASQMAYSKASVEARSSKLAEDKRPNRNNGLILAPLLLIAAPIFAGYDLKKILPLYDVTVKEISHVRLTRAYGTFLFTYFADYSAITILPPSPELASIQTSLAKKVSQFRYDDIVSSVYAQSAALSGKDCLAKAIAYKMWLMDKAAFASFKSDVAKSKFQQMDVLVAFNRSPYPVEWPKANAETCR